MAVGDSADGSKSPADAVITAAYVVPVVPKDVVLRDHAVVVHNGRVVAVLPQAEAQSKYIALQLAQLGDQILLPGLVNAHSHAGMTLLRGFSDDKPLHQWLGEDIWPAESQFVNPVFVRDGVLLAAAEMIRSGTTCMNDMYFFPDETCEVLERVGLRGVVGQIVLDVPSSYASSASEYFEKARAALEKYKTHELISLTVAPHAPYMVGENSLLQSEALSQEYNVPIHIHMHETLAECQDSEHQSKSSMNCCHRSEEHLRPLANFKRLGLLSDRLVCVHMTQLTEEEIDSIASATSHVVHCPSSNLKLASGICPVSALLKRNVNVAIGTDSAASNNRLDMFAEMRLAALLAKVNSMESASVSAATALQMATLNGAKALGLESEIGSLEVGKRADLIAIACGSTEMMPLYSAISHLLKHLLHLSGWLKLLRVLEDRNLLTIDINELKQVTLDWQHRVDGFQRNRHQQH
uniref:Amidohydrolase-related domain-containing protein n=1 Tax=Globisporangium ultimum (strain ATCC 200006 / CBS 805.95 / DAOM BR144) TaxID=431595 RepID=K3W661_GLOUD